MAKKTNHPVQKGVCKVPMVMQLETLECGAACLTMILAYYGKWVPLEQVSDKDILDASDSDAGPEREIPDDVLKQIMATLSPVRRAVFNMYYIDGFSHKEIARALNITEGGSTSILAKARASVRKAITDYLKATGQ